MTHPEEKIRKLLEISLAKLNLKAEIRLEYPKLLSHGDFSTNVAMVLAKEKKVSPLNLASAIVAAVPTDLTIAKIVAAPPGFINFYLAPKIFEENIKLILKEKENFGKGKHGQKVAIEYTDPNPFKEFHIGHLMSNTIGEAISRLVEASGARVVRINYQGDVGIHVACAIFGLLEFGLPPEAATLLEKIAFLGRAYALGAAQYEKKKSEIEALNKKIYEKSDPKINEIYEKGRKWSLDYFATIYEKLGSKFDFFFFESEGGEFGKKIVLANLGKVFEESAGAVVFKGEKYGLHTRVFLNSFGLPTYEAKELALAKMKYDAFPYDLSLIVTGNEIVDYFKVLLKVMSLIFPELAEKTRHLPHGMLRLPTGKMASRKGEVITALSLIDLVKQEILKKTDSSRFADEKEKEEISEIVAIGAIKFFILKQAPGRDIIFDLKKAISLEGDSGPYLQYTAVRANSVLEKAKEKKILPVAQGGVAEDIERLLFRYPAVFAKAAADFSPQHLVGFLLDLAQAFNNYYNKTTIVDESKEAAAKVALTAAVFEVIKGGLNILGIKVPPKM